MRLHESAEDYLERILMLQIKNGRVKSIDIANDMNFTKASVSIAMKKLKDEGHIIVDDKGLITLTSSGLDIAQHIYERHETISKTLIALGVNKEQALIDACKIEHDLSEESYQAIKKHINKAK